MSDVYAVSYHELFYEFIYSNQKLLKATMRVFVIILFACAISTTTQQTEEEWMKTLKQFLPQAPHCGKDAQDRIFGGHVVALSEFPWTVLLNYDKSNLSVDYFSSKFISYSLLGDNKTGFYCGGSLINERYVLTS